MDYFQSSAVISLVLLNHLLCSLEILLPNSYFLFALFSVLCNFSLKTLSLFLNLCYFFVQSIHSSFVLGNRDFKRPNDLQIFRESSLFFLNSSVTLFLILLKSLSNPFELLDLSIQLLYFSIHWLKLLPHIFSSFYDIFGVFFYFLLERVLFMIQLVLRLT